MLIVFSLILSIDSKAVSTSLLTSTLILSKFSSIPSLKVANLLSVLTSDSAINFLYFGTSTLKKPFTVSDRFAKSSFILSTVFPLIDDILDSILVIDSSTKRSCAIMALSKSSFLIKVFISSLISLTSPDTLSTFSKLFLKLSKVEVKSDKD